MDNLTSILLDKNTKHDIKDTTHQGIIKTSLSGKESIYRTNTMPFFAISITYTNLTYQELSELFLAYETNYAKTFLVDIDEDIREQLLDSNMNTFAFKPDGFKYSINAQERFYRLTIDLLSSSMYNNT